MHSHLSFVLVAMTFCVCVCISYAVAQQDSGVDWENPEIFAINKEPPHASQMNYPKSLPGTSG